MTLYLGIDTSAYTTSVALVNAEGKLIQEYRKVLDVPQGERGLAQSAALFQHVQNLPHLVEKIPTDFWPEIKGIGVSAAPRPVKGSYMPVFTPGVAIATSLAAALRVPLLKTSHQEGHLAAGIHSSELTQEHILAIHISGGTTELLEVKSIEPGKLGIDILGGTTDLHAGQFIDRVGVALGLPFPAGPTLEELARGGSDKAASLLPSAVKGLQVSFSGVESAAQRLIQGNTPPADVARAVEGCIVRTMTKLIKNGLDETKLSHLLVVGGVASNQYFRQELTGRLGKKAQIYWALPQWSRDNAIGVAILAAENVLRKKIKEGNSTSSSE